MKAGVWTRLPPSLLIAFATFAVLGLTGGLLGVSWPAIRLTFDQPLGALGLVMLADTVGYTGASFLSGPIARGIGRGWLLVAGAVSALVGLSAIVAAPAWASLVAGYALLGVAGGIYDGTLNGHVALTGGVRSMNLLHGMWGLGAAIGPPLAYAMGRSVFSWRGAYLIVAVLELVLAVTFFATRPQWRVREEHEPDHALPSHGVRRVMLILSLAAFFLYTGIELGGGQWCYSLFISWGTPGALAALTVTAYWVALSAGRLGLGLLPWRLDPRHVVAASLTLALVGASLALVTPLGFPVLALGLAPVFPTLMTLTPLRFGRATAASVAGYQVGMAAAGAGVFGAFLGILFNAVGIGRLPLTLLLALLLLALLIGGTELGLRVWRPSGLAA